MEIRPIDANALADVLLDRLTIGVTVDGVRVLRNVLGSQEMDTLLNDAPTLSINTLRDAIYQDAVEHGLWEDENNAQGWPTECAAMIECETDELYDAVQQWEDSHVNDNEHFVEELADVVIMCFSVAGKLGIDIDAAIRNKMAVNKKRPWKSNGREGVRSENEGRKSISTKNIHDADG